MELNGHSSKSTFHFLFFLMSSLQKSGMEDWTPCDANLEHSNLVNIERILENLQTLSANMQNINTDRAQAELEILCSIERLHNEIHLIKNGLQNNAVPLFRRVGNFFMRCCFRSNSSEQLK